MAEGTGEFLLSYMSWCSIGSTFEQMVEMAQRFGYDALDPVVGAGHAHGLEPGLAPERLAEARRLLGEAGLKVGCLATALEFAEGGERARANLETLKTVLPLAAELGAPYVRVLAGPLPPGLELMGMLGRMCDVLEEAADAAQEHNVVLLLNTHDNFIHSKFVREAVRGTFHEHLAAAWEVAATLRALESVEEAYENLGDALRYVYIQDIRYKPDMSGFEPVLLGEGIVPAERALRLLVRHDHPVTVCAKTSGELGREPEKALPVYAAKLRGYLATALAAAESAADAEPSGSEAGAAGAAG